MLTTMCFQHNGSHAASLAHFDYAHWAQLSTHYIIVTHTVAKCQYKNRLGNNVSPAHQGQPLTVPDPGLAADAPGWQCATAVCVT